MGGSLRNPQLLPEEPLEAADAPTPAKSLSRPGFGTRFCSSGISPAAFFFQGVAERGSFWVPRMISERF